MNGLDREKVMSWLEGLSEPDWRDFHSDSEVQNIAKSALALLKEQEKPNGKCVNECECWDSAYERGKQDSLKEQEAVEPKKTAYQRVDHTIACRYCCGMCGMSIFPSYKYCPFCGQAVKWE